MHRVTSSQARPAGTYVRGLDGKDYPASRTTSDALGDGIVSFLIVQPDWSLRQIAKAVGVGSPATVLRYRRLLGRSPVSNVTAEQPPQEADDRSPVPDVTSERTEPRT